MTDLLNTAHQLLDLAKQQGATAADVIVGNARSSSASVRQGEVESVETEEAQDISLRVIIDGRVAGTSGNLRDASSLSAMAERAVAMAHAAPVDPWVVLATKDQYAGIGGRPELDLHDATELSPEALIERAMTAEASGLAQPGVSKSGGASAGYSQTEVAFATSEGFSNHRLSSSFSCGLSLITGDGEDMQRDYAGDGARHLVDLEDPAAIGKLAGERTAKRFGAKPRAGGTLPVVFDPRVANSLISGLLGSINGGGIARGTSFLKEKLGERILPAGLNLVDAPHVARGRRSRAVDAEGLATAAQNWVEDGVLMRWVLDLGTAKQLGLESNACAVRGMSGGPGPSASNVTLEGGRASQRAVLADIKQGLYITEMMGRGLNGLTGDYSRGAGGFWIENGELTEPVSEMTVAGNLLDMFADIVVCDDLELKYGIDSPTLMIPSLSVAGQG